MFKRTLIPVITASALAAGLAFSAPASAGTAWSVSIAGPGYAVAAGQPIYVASPRFYGARHWHHGYVRRVIYPAPVVVAPPVVYRAPVVYRPAVVYSAPRVVYSAPVVVRPW